MNYWGDMHTRSGFNDGESIPPDAAAARDIYLRAVNRLAEARGSRRRKIAYDRPGFPNPYLIATISAEAYDSLNDKQRFRGSIDLKRVARCECDELLDQAVRQACELDLDQYVKIGRITLDLVGLNRALAACIKAAGPMRQPRGR